MPTIKDVAKRSNVSVATVSRVLNNSGYVNTETRKIVERAIVELGYIPNELARSLYRKQSKIIGMIVPHLSTYFFSGLIERIEEFFAEKDYKLMIFNAREDLSREEKMLQVFNQYNLNGFILVTHVPHLENYLKLNKPMIAIDHRNIEHIPTISSDNVEGGKIAAKHLIENGCREILHIRGPSVLLTVQDRTEGFESVLNQHGLDHVMLDLDFRRPDMTMIKDFIKEHPEADAIFCDSDTIAITTIRALHLLGRKVPDDVQVLGFDNVEIGELITPSLSTIEQSIEMLAKTAYEKLLGIIEGDGPGKNHTITPVRLIQRESTKKK